jgi:hypothetical protein
LAGPGLEAGHTARGLILNKAGVLKPKLLT